MLGYDAALFEVDSREPEQGGCLGDTDCAAIQLDQFSDIENELGMESGRARSSKANGYLK